MVIVPSPASGALVNIEVLAEVFDDFVLGLALFSLDLELHLQQRKLLSQLLVFRPGSLLLW